MRLDEGYIYDFELKEHQKEVAEFWSQEDDKQLALQETE